MNCAQKASLNTGKVNTLGARRDHKQNVSSQVCLCVCGGVGGLTVLPFSSAISSSKPSAEALGALQYLTTSRNLGSRKDSCGKYYLRGYVSE